jgi:hypothetical protein
MKLADVRTHWISEEEALRRLEAKETQFDREFRYWIEAVVLDELLAFGYSYYNV